MIFIFLFLFLKCIKDIRYVGEALVENQIDGTELINLNHSQLENKYNIKDASKRKKMLNAVGSLYVCLHKYSQLFCFFHA